MAMIYFLDGNQRVIKIVRSDAVISAIQTQELPEDNSLLRDYLSVRLKNDERLFNAQYMAIKSYGGNRNAFDLYRIASEIVPDNATEFVGVQVAPYELEGAVVEDLRPQYRPLDLMMNQLLEDTDWRLGYMDDNLPTVSTNFYYVSVKDALKQLQDLIGVEFLFKVEISGNEITDKWVEVYREVGNRTRKRFNYGTNALSVVRESSHDELYTALIGRGKGEEVSSAEDNPGGQAGYGRKINFAEVEWKKSDGKPVDKPKGQKYIELPNATAEYGIKLIDGRKVPRIGLVEFSETDDPNVLINQTWQELLVRARPKVLFKASVINTGDMLIGDTVTIHRHDLGFHYEARVRKVVRDRKNNNKTQLEIGDVVHTPSTKRQGKINSALNNVANDLESVRGEITEARQSADGKNTNNYGNVEPDRKKVGDTWFRDHPSLTGESQILVWNGEAWELIMDTSETTKVAEDILEAKGIAETARDNALNIATDLIEGTSFYKHTQDIGLASKNSDGTINSIINLGSDGTAYVGGENIVLDGNTIVDGTFTITDKMIAPNAEIDGAKIADATIGSAKIAGLDVDKISGNTTNFVQSNWNSAAGGNVRITGSGILTTASDDSQTYIQDGIVGTRNPSGATIGQLGYFYNNDSPWYTMQVSNGSHFQINMSRGEGRLNKQAFYIMSGGFESYLNTDRIYMNPAEFMTVQGRLNVEGNLLMSGGNINNAYGIYLDYGGSFYTVSGGQTRVEATAGLALRVNRNIVAMSFDSTYGYMHMNLSMEGNNITNQSDARLKTDISTRQESSLEKINQFNFVDFEWLKNGRADFGVIAQQVQQVAPELTLEGADGYLSVNNSLLNMMTTHGLQELNNKHELVISIVDSHTDTIHTLQQELSEANRRIKELEEKIAS